MVEETLSDKQTFEEWYIEDAKRLNEMTEIARKSGVVVEVGKKKEKKITKVFRKLSKKEKSDS